MMDFLTVCRRLEAGEIRVAEKVDGRWKVNTWIKEAILEGFRIGKLKDWSEGEYSFFDKDTLPLRRFALEDRVRIVPGGSSVRRGAYLAPSVIMMPPSYVNIGAYVDEGSMIDSHALVGSCAQIGKRVHISAASQIGGVLEPAGAVPVIIEDDAFIGAVSVGLWVADTATFELQLRQNVCTFALRKKTEQPMPIIVTLRPYRHLTPNIIWH